MRTHRTASGNAFILRVVACTGLMMFMIAPSVGEERQPKTIWELIYAFDHTFKQILTPEEQAIKRGRSPEEIKEIDRELYRKISQNVVRWTDNWLIHIDEQLESTPEKRREKTAATADRIDGILRSYFEAREWPYRRLEVVFLPQRLFFDERHRGRTTRGLFVPFYPDLFFATIDPSSPMELVLIHESLHYNKRGTPFGTPLSEGITEVATEHLVFGQGLLPKGILRHERYYPKEQDLVDGIIDRMIARTGSSREEALELLLGAYITGDQSRMHAIFGEESWDRVIELSRTARKWHKLKKGIEEALK